MRDRYDLQRFVDAQQPVYGRVTDELRAGDKRSHWMRFIFPQIKGIGSSPTAQRYAISGLDEVRDYLDHPVLGPRLRECTAIVNGIEGKTLDEILRLSGQSQILRIDDAVCRRRARQCAIQSGASKALRRRARSAHARETGGRLISQCMRQVRVRAGEWKCRAVLRTHHIRVQTFFKSVVNKEKEVVWQISISPARR